MQDAAKLLMPLPSLTVASGRAYWERLSPRTQNLELRTELGSGFLVLGSAHRKVGTRSVGGSGVIFGRRFRVPFHRSGLAGRPCGALLVSVFAFVFSCGN